jgi:Arc/MetJ-type ribon-helix-helix transcriptional regulator
VRTTVDIPAELLAEAKVLAARGNRSLSAVVNDALRTLLARQGESPARVDWAFPTDGAGGLRPGVNLEDKEALAELLGDNVVSAQ